MYVNMLLTGVSLIFGLAWKWPDQNPKKTQKTKGDFLDFVV
jgi:hypothetical protein